MFYNVNTVVFIFRVYPYECHLLFVKKSFKQIVEVHLKSLQCGVTRTPLNLNMPMASWNIGTIYVRTFAI